MEGNPRAAIVIRWRPLFLLGLLPFVSACEKRPNLSPEATRGKAVYQSNCTACHNSDPTRPGSTGPEVAGASQDLLEARVMRAEYPPGYTPKRTTHQMGPFPHLQADLPALQAYLATFK